MTHLSLVLLTALMVLLPRQAAAWSSPSSRTFMNILVLENAIEEYRADFGSFPDPKSFRSDLQSREYLVPSEGRNPFLDSWGHEIIFRLPGLHGEFDIYSVGEDGIDNHGKNDDVSRWLGVNEGYYYKRDWPRGRFTIKATCAVGFVILISGAYFSWRTVIPLAGMIVTSGVSLGCYWLLHPGHDPSRNLPLSMAMVCAGLVFVAFLTYLGVAIRKNHRAQQAVATDSDKPPI